MTHRHAWKIAVWLTIALITAGLTGCGLLGDTPESRIDEFFSAINSGDWSGLRDSLDPDAASYNTANETFWQQYFPESATYSASNVVDHDGYATASVSGGSLYSAEQFTFYFTEEPGLIGNVLLINRIDRGSTTIFD